MKSVHEDIKNHKCSFCDKAFNSLRKLKMHVKVVHDNIEAIEKKYEKNEEYEDPLKTDGIKNETKTENEYQENHIKSVHEGLKIFSNVSYVTKVLNSKQASKVTLLSFMKV